MHVFLYFYWRYNVAPSTFTVCTYTRQMYENVLAGVVARAPYCVEDVVMSGSARNGKERVDISIEKLSLFLWSLRYKDFW